MYVVAVVSTCHQYYVSTSSVCVPTNGQTDYVRTCIQSVTYIEPDDGHVVPLPHERQRARSTCNISGATEDTYRQVRSWTPTTPREQAVRLSNHSLWPRRNVCTVVGSDTEYDINDTVNSKTCCVLRILLSLLCIESRHTTRKCRRARPRPASRASSSPWYCFPSDVEALCTRRFLVNNRPQRSNST